MLNKKVIILYDLIAREYWMTNRIASELIKKGYEVHIFQWNFEYYKVIKYSKKHNIDMLIIPSCYTDADFERVVMPIQKNSTNLKVVCMNNEQIGYFDSEEALVPKSDLCRNSMYHFSWGSYFTNLLIKHGVPNLKIIEVGSLRLQEALEKDIIKSRQELAIEFGLDPNKKWLLYCDSAGELYSNLLEKGLSSKEIIYDSDLASKMIKSYAEGYQKTKDIFNQLGNEFYSEFEIIFRIHPGTIEYRNKHLDSKYRLIKDYSIYTWLRHVEFNIVAISTSIFESDALGIKSFVLNPIKFEHDVVGVVDYSITRTKEEFLRMVYNPNTENIISNKYGRYIGDLSSEAFNKFCDEIIKILESPDRNIILNCGVNNKKKYTSLVANLAFYLFLNCKILDKVTKPITFAMNKYEHPHFKEKYI